MLSNSQLDHLRIPFEQILKATDNFNEQNLIGNGGYGKVYTGKMFRSSTSTGTGTGGEYVRVAVKRLLSGKNYDQGDKEFLAEVRILSTYKHHNLISLVGFCEEKGEKILVYDLAKRASLDRYLVANKSANNELLTWKQRLKICIGAARGLDYLHNGLGPDHIIIHRDVKCSNILLDKNWEAKVSDFGLSRVKRVNEFVDFSVTRAVGTLGYCDPIYRDKSILTKESDIYSFGVILFQVLCGQPAVQQEYEGGELKFLDELAKSHFKQKRLHEIIDPRIKESIRHESLAIFSALAYQCLEDDRGKRPTMTLIVKELERALYHQETRIGMMESGEHLIIDPRQLTIAWGDNEQFWTWNQIEDEDGQRIEIAKLRQVYWLTMKGTYTIPDSHLGIECEIAFDVMLERNSSGWEQPITLKLSHPHRGEIQVQERKICIKDMPKEQWRELHVGNFKIEKGENRQVSFELYETGDYWKKGLIVKRVIIRKV